MNKHGLFDIQGAWHIPFWQTRTFYYVIIGTLAILLIILIWRLIIKYRRRPIILPSWDQAIIELEGYKKHGLVTVEHSKEFYSKLTQTIKNYLHRRYEIDTYGKTDEELMTYLSHLDFDSTSLEELKSIFSGMLVIKFANMRGAQEQIERDWRASIAFIRRTKPNSP
jgi:hypothetical protein